MNNIEKAINFAAKAHAGKMRKSTAIPYITHPFRYWGIRRGYLEAVQCGKIQFALVLRSIVNILLPRKKEFGLIDELEKEVKSVFKWLPTQ